jgi:hypothetical protein
MPGRNSFCENCFAGAVAAGDKVDRVFRGLTQIQVRFGKMPLQRTRSDGQAFKPGRPADRSNAST